MYIIIHHYEKELNYAILLKINIKQACFPYNEKDY